MARLQPAAEANEEPQVEATAGQASALPHGRLAVCATDVCKWFPLKARRRPFLSILKGATRRRQGRETVERQAGGFQALDRVTLKIAAGEKVGLIGNNGAGKTTFLKLLAGLYRPSSGEIRVEGSVTLLAGVGLGMLEELSLKQNIYLYGAIYGVTREKVNEHLEDILRWAELEDFLEAKLKSLSRGMKSRLAFSITRHIDSEVCLMDEALSGGDRGFRDKCLEVFETYKKSSRTYIAASHNIDVVRQLCDRTLWLHHGKTMAWGETAAVLEQYEEFNQTNAGR